MNDYSTGQKFNMSSVLVKATYLRTVLFTNLLLSLTSTQYYNMVKLFPVCEVQPQSKCYNFA